MYFDVTFGIFLSLKRLFVPRTVPKNFWVRNSTLTVTVLLLHLHSSTAKLKPIETAIREKKDLQKQVLAYAKTRDVRDGLKKQKTDKARKAYREKHESDFIIADAAVRYFRQKGITKLPTYKSLQAEIEQLTAEKNALYNEYRANKERVRELQTMKSNLSQMHHGEPSRQKKHEQER